VRAAPVQGGIEVHARIQTGGAGDACTVRATVHDAAGNELAHQSSKLKAGAADASGDEVVLLVATPKDAAKAKALRVSAHPQFAVQLECGGHPPVHSGLLPVQE